MASGKRRANEYLVEQRHKDQQDGRSEGKRPQKRMKSENDENVYLSPGQIEDGVNPRARNELTERIEVAQHWLRAPPEAERTDRMIAVITRAGDQV